MSTIQEWDAIVKLFVRHYTSYVDLQQHFEQLAMIPNLPLNQLVDDDLLLRTYAGVITPDADTQFPR